MKKINLDSNWIDNMGVGRDPLESPGKKRHKVSSPSHRNQNFSMNTNPSKSTEFKISPFPISLVLHSDIPSKIKEMPTENDDTSVKTPRTDMLRTDNVQ